METPKATFNLTEKRTELEALSPDLTALTGQRSFSEADEQLLTVPEFIRGENEFSSLFNLTDSSVESNLALATSHSANSTQDSGLLKESSQYALGLLAILCVVLISASTSTATKQALVHFSPSVLFAIRFAIAAIIFVPFVREFNLRLLRDSTILGLIVFGRFACQTIGLQTISANRASFFFGLSVVFVTLFEVVFRKRMSAKAILASGLAFSGMAIMSWEGGEPLSGNLWLLASALLDTLNLLLLERFARHHPTLPLTGIRIWVIAILGLLWATPEMAGQFQALPESWGAVVYLGVVATVILFLLYTIAMRWIPAYEAALFGPLEPVFGAIIAFFLLGETFGIYGFMGAAMVLSGMILGLSRSIVNQDSSDLSTAIDSKELSSAN